MRILVDTHIFLWATTAQELMTPQAGVTLRDARNEIWLSAASVWETRLKLEKGKLDLATPLDLMVRTFLGPTRNFLDVVRDHAVTGSPDGVKTLDPFDRMLLAQCACENMRLLTVDRHLADHSLAVPLS